MTEFTVGHAPGAVLVTVTAGDGMTPAVARMMAAALMERADLADGIEPGDPEPEHPETDEGDPLGAAYGCLTMAEDWAYSREANYAAASASALMGIGWALLAMWENGAKP